MNEWVDLELKLGLKVEMLNVGLDLKLGLQLELVLTFGLREPLFVEGGEVIDFLSPSKLDKIKQQ